MGGSSTVQATQFGVARTVACDAQTEEVYCRSYEHRPHARESLGEFSEYYNRRRPHWPLIPELGGDPLVPEEVYAGVQAIQIPRCQAWVSAAKAMLEQLLEDGA